jgi:hypothetical protein
LFNRDLRAIPEFGNSEKEGSLISTYWSLAITAITSGFEKLSTALIYPLACQRFYAFESC